MNIASLHLSDVGVAGVLLAPRAWETCAMPIASAKSENTAISDMLT